MAVDIKLKRSSVPGKIPTTSSLELGELALNTYDGKVYMKKQVGNVQSIIEVGSGSGGAGGTVTSVSVSSANGFAGSVANPSTTPTITLSTTVTGILQGNGTSISAATAGTDYITPTQGTASWAVNAVTASYFSGSIANAISASYASSSTSASYALVATSASYASSSTSASYSLNATSASYALVAFSASYASSSTSASYASSSTSASYALNATSASYAATSSYANNFTVAGTLTAQTIVVQIITSSQELVTGSLIVSGSLTALGGVTGSLLGTASWAQNAITASYVLNAISASYASSSTSASYALFATSASYASASTSASYAANATSASYSLNATSASYASASTSASYASSSTSASYALNATSASYASSSTSASFANVAVSASYASSSTSASYALIATSASYASSSTSASYALFATSASYASASTSASYAVSSTSASYASASTSASYALFATSASYASSSTSASYSQNATSASYALNATSASYALFATSASYASASTSASYAVSTSVAVSASYASASTSASYALFATSASYASASTSASYALVATSASYASASTSASYAVNATSASYALFTTSASYASSSTSASYASSSTSASYASSSTSASYAVNSTSASYALFATSASYASSSTSASYASASTSASYAQNATSASYALNATNAATASSADNFTVRGTLTAQTLIVQVITSSQELITGSLTVSGSLNALGGVTGSLLGTASWANNAISASYSNNSTSASYALFATSASYASASTSASYAVSASVAISASYASASTSASYALNATSASYALNATSASYALFATSASYASSSTSASYASASTSASYASSSTSASYALNATSASYALFATSASYASSSTSASYASASTSASYALFATSASYASASTSASYAATATTAAFASTIPNNLNITASNILVSSNLTVNGTASFNYVQTVSGSAVIIGEEFIILNTQLPAARFAGLQIYDSGSNSTSSLVWDSQTNHFVYSNVSGASYSGGMFIAGPKNTGSLGQEQTLTQWRVPVAQGDDHIMDSQIYSSGSITQITGSLTVTAGVTGSLQGTASWANNATTASYALFSTSASYASASTSASYASASTSASYALNATSASYALVATSASYASASTSASYALNATSASYAATASFIPTSSLIGNFFVQGGNSFGAQALLGTNDTQNLAFETSGAIRMTITSGGSVGVGITTPSHPLDVFTSSLTTIARFYANDGTFNPRFTIEGTSEGIRLFQTYSTTAGNLMFGTGATERMRISTGGNVGIGTTTPVATLHVSRDGGAGTIRLLRIDNSNATYQQNVYLDMNTSKDILWSQGSANGGTFWDAGVRGYGFSINSSRIVTFDQNGNVGIGTTSPSQKLHVKGNTLIENGADTTSTVRNAGVLLWTDNAYGMQLHHDGTSWGTAIFARASDSDVRLGHYAGGATAQNTFTSSLVVKNTGNVGINTSSPTNRLQVVGGVTATSFTGSLLGTASYANNSDLLDGLDSTVFTLTSSFQSYTASINATTASIQAATSSLQSATASLNTFSSSILSFTSSANNRLNALEAATASLNSFSASILSYTSSNNTNISSLNAQTASLLNYTQSLNNKTSSFATTGSNTFIGNQTITGSIFQSGSLTVNGTITATTLVVQTITSSISVVTGSMTVSGSLTVLQGITGSLFGTSSWAISASQALTASYTPSINGTTNYVAKFTAGSTIGNSTIYDDGSYVGISTTGTTPYSGLFPGRLVVDAGTGNVDGVFVTTNNTNAAELILTKKNPTNNFGSLLIQHSGSSGDAIAVNYSVNTTTGTGGVNSFKVTTDGKGYFAGSVGIGTTSPSYILDVQSNISAEPYVQARFLNTNVSNQFGGILVNGINQAHIRFLTGTSTWGGAGAKQWQIRTGIAANVDALSIYSWTAGSDLLYINSSGNVGIGTTNPTQKLHVVGNVAVVNGQIGLTQNYGITWNNGDNYIKGISGYHLQFTTYDGSASQVEVMRLTGGSSGGARVGIGTTIPSAKLHVSASTGVVFEVDGASSSTILYVSASGYVGISATSPVSFETFGVAKQWSRFYNTTSTDYALIDVSNTTNTARIGVENSSGGSLATGTSAYSSVIGSIGNYNLNLITNNSIRLFVSASGNVGIGTTSPTLATLQVNGNVWANSFTGSFSGSIANISGTTNYVSKFTSANVIGNSQIYDNGSIVGVGTTSPLEYFHIKTSAYATPLLVEYSGGTTAYLGLVNTGGRGYLMTNNNDLVFGTTSAATERMRILSGGNVGIGTTSPSSVLHVRGAASGDTSNVRIASTGTYGGINIYEDTTVRLYLAYGDSGNVFSNGQADSANIRGSNYLQLGASSTATITINGANDYVGIGTTSPTYKLDVVGSSRIQATSGSNSSVTLDITAGNGSYDAYIDYGYWSSTFDATVWQVGNFGSDSSKFKIKASASGNAFDRFIVTQGGEIHMGLSGSNVGIGTTSPNAAFNIVTPSADTTGDAFVFKGSNGKEFVSIHKLGFIRTRASDTNGANMHFFDNNGNKRMEMSVGATTMNWYSDALASTFMVFQHSSGNVGIGTTSPSARLHVSGAAANAVYVNRTGGSATLYGANDLVFETDSTFYFGAYTARTFLVNSVNGTAGTFTITSAGNVGVGNQGPTEKLHVSGNIRLQQASNVDAYLTLNPNTSALGTSYQWNVVGSNSAYNYGFQIREASTPYLHINNSAGSNAGFVGIGTTSPAQKLDVSGSVNVRSSSPTILFDRNGSYTWRLINGDGGTYPVSTFNIANNGGTAIATFLDGGNVGIGTTTPLAKLDVEGNLLIRNAQFEATSSATSGATTLATIATGSYKAVFVDYVALSGSNQRAGTFMGTWNSSTVQYTDYSTVDIGTTSAVTMSVSISGGNALVQATTPASWTVTATYRTI